MLIGERLIFVHVPKTGGESIADFLVRNLPGPKTLVAESDLPNRAIRLPPLVVAKLRTKALLKKLGLWYSPSLAVRHGKRHARLGEIREIVADEGRSLDEFRAIIAVVRNPYDLEVSRYHYLRKGYHGVRGLARSREQRMAIEKDFETFARKAPFHARLPAGIEDWYEMDGRIPANLHMVRFERLEEDVAGVLAEFCPRGGRLRKLNASRHGHYREYVSAGAEEAIYRKYRWLFDKGIYARENFASASASATPLAEKHPNIAIPDSGGAPKCRFIGKDERAGSRVDSSRSHP